ncbi:MAG: hypothetical protein R3E89_07415 [Thiolinea sp.]
MTKLAACHYFRSGKPALCFSLFKSPIVLLLTVVLLLVNQTPCGPRATTAAPLKATAPD